VNTRRGLALAVLAVTLAVAGALARGGGGGAGVPAGAPAAADGKGVTAVNVAAADPAGVRPGGCTAIDRRINLYAVELPKDPITNQVRLGYGTTPATASYPGPLIEMIEGECLAITLYNQVPQATLESLRTDPNHPIGVSLHTHGVKYTQKSDGTVQSNSFVPPGGSYTYIWYAQPRNTTTGAQGTAGYWWYHDHVVGGPHGTVGIGSGLFGGLVVRRQGDPRPDRTYVLGFGDRQTINLRRSSEADTCDEENPVPGPTCVVATVGEKVEFLVIGLGNDMHTFHVHGHSWADTRTGVIDGSKQLVDSVPIIDNKTVGPGDTFGARVIAGESVGPGNWMLHCHMQFHSDLGMSTTFHVLDENGAMTTHAGHAPENPVQAAPAGAGEDATAHGNHG
jgi:FtsP/CotA-like multicopper oxidase with cupredoxin domain